MTKTNEKKYQKLIEILEKIKRTKEYGDYCFTNHHFSYKNIPYKDEALTILSEIEELSIFNNKMQVFREISLSVSYNKLLRWLLNRIELNDLTVVIEWLCNYVEHEYYTEINYIWLNGIKIENNLTYEIIDGIYLCPITSIPNRILANQLSGDSYPFNFFQPSVVLYKEYQAEKHHKEIGDTEKTTTIYQTYDLDDIRLLISILNHSVLSPQALGYSYLPADDVPCSNNISLHITGYRQPGVYPPLMEMEIIKLKEMYSKFRTLGEKRKKQIRKILSRLNEYSTCSNPVDKAIAFRIVAETIYINKHISYIKSTLSDRFSEFHNDGTNEAYLKKIMKTFYEVTSSANHAVELVGDDLVFANINFKDFIPYFFDAIIYMLEGKTFSWEQS
ncbi:MAG: hypothetical protein AB1Z23_11365 [Eubacteriales bacterium]